MSYDVGLQPTAQKYFVLALHAAKEAGDKPLGSYILSSMSRQMIHLGRPDDALELIHLAQYGSRDCATARTQAMLYAMEARAYANMGQPSKCKRAVRMAEDTFADAGLEGEPEPDWIRFFSEAELNGENSHSYRDLAYVAGRSPTYASLAEPLMERAVELFEKDPDHQRSYALNLIGLATVHLLKREPEQSVVLAEKALGVARSIRSERVNTRLRKTVDHAARGFGDVAESSGSPTGSPSSSPRPPKRSDPLPGPRGPARTPAAPDVPYCPTRLPRRKDTRTPTRPVRVPRPVPAARPAPYGRRVRRYLPVTRVFTVT